MRKTKKDCYFCPYIQNCPDRKTAKKDIDLAANREKKNLD